MAGAVDDSTINIVVVIIIIIITIVRAFVSWRHGSVVRTSVFGWQTFPDLWFYFIVTFMLAVLTIQKSNGTNK